MATQVHTQAYTQEHIARKNSEGFIFGGSIDSGRRPIFMHFFLLLYIMNGFIGVEHGTP